MVKTLTFSLAAILALTACADPQLQSECENRICGSVNNSQGGEGGTNPVVTSGGGQMVGVGGAGGSGGMGQGGDEPLAITIVSPNDGMSFNHGQLIDFAAVVTPDTAGIPASQIRWRSTLVTGIFGTGYTHVRSLTSVGTHQITAAIVMGDSNVVAEDTITLDAL